MTILVKVWLLVAGFYRRAALYEDARGAVEEAYKLVESMDAEVSKDSSGKISISCPGLGGGKSVSELWGDIYSEVRILFRYSTYSMNSCLMPHSAVLSLSQNQRHTPHSHISNQP